MTKPLVTENLTKTYKLAKGKTRTAVDSLSLEVPEGSIFGFLGPNGAGKTTTIKLILDFVRPTSGKVTVLGQPTSNTQTRQLIGYMPEQPYFHRFLKPMEVLCMHAALAGVERREIRKQAMSALERTGIAEYSDTPIAKLSKGLTQRVGIAQAIIGNPKLLILDEPTSGLDPIGRRHTRDLLVDLKNEGKTIFLSSHVLSEIENICDTVAVMKSGKLIACGKPDSIQSPDYKVTVQTTGMDAAWRERLTFLNIEVESGSDHTTLKFDQNRTFEVMRAMEALNLPILQIDTLRESLEEAFLRLAA